jgi:hypothetical protein
MSVDPKSSLGAPKHKKQNAISFFNSVLFFVLVVVTFYGVT